MVTRREALCGLASLATLPLVGLANETEPVAKVTPAPDNLRAAFIVFGAVDNPPERSLPLRKVWIFGRPSCIDQHQDGELIWESFPLLFTGKDNEELQNNDTLQHLSLLNKFSIVLYHPDCAEVWSFEGECLNTTSFNGGTLIVFAPKKVKYNQWKCD